MYDFILGLYPSLFIAFLGAYSYHTVDSLRADLVGDCEYEDESFGGGLSKRWYLKSASLSALSALSTVALGAAISILSLIHPGVLEVLYTLIIMAFFVFWVVHTALVSITVMNSKCRLALRNVCFCFEIAPILALLGVGVHFVGKIPSLY